MTDLKRKLMQARPRLRDVAPLTAAIVLGFGITNILLGIGMMFYVNPSPQATFTVVTGLLTFPVWGVVFLALGIFKLWAYFRNNWNAMRTALIVGLAVKATWAIALAIRWIDGGSVLLLIIWGFFAYVQAATYVNFIPNKVRRK